MVVVSVVVVVVVVDVVIVGEWAFTCPSGWSTALISEGEVGR